MIRCISIVSTLLIFFVSSEKKEIYVFFNILEHTLNFVSKQIYPGQISRINDLHTSFKVYQKANLFLQKCIFYDECILHIGAYMTFR